MKKIFSLAVLISLAQFSFGQGGIKVEPVKVISSYKPVLTDPTKVLINPSLPEVEKENPTFAYDKFDTQMKTIVGIENIPASSAKKESVEKAGIGYLKAGYGNFQTPFLDFNIMNSNHKNLQYSLFGSYLSSAAKLKFSDSTLNFASNSQAKLGGNFTYHADKVRVGFNSKYSRNQNYLYGHELFDSIAKVGPDSIRLLYNQISVGAFLESAGKSKVKHATTINFRNFSAPERLLQTESNILVKTNLSFPVQKTRIGAEVGVDFNNYSRDTISIKNNLFWISPYASFSGEMWTANAGFSFVNQGMPSADSSKSYFYPNLNFKYNIVDKAISFIAGANGQLKPNYFSKMATDNPFLSNAIQINYTSNSINFFGGLEGNFGPGWDFKFVVEQSSYKNAMFFMNDSINPSSFVPVYDSSSKSTALTLQVTKQFTSKFSMMSEVNFKKWTVSTLDAAYYAPLLSSNFRFFYDINEKLKLNASVYIMSPRSYNDTSGVKTLPTIIDANIGGEYALKPNFRFFATVSNLTATNYQRWYNYPVYGLNFMGGFKWLF